MTLLSVTLRYCNRCVNEVRRALGSLTIDLTLSHSQDVPDMLAGEYARTDQLERKGTKDEGTAGGGDWEELRWSHMCGSYLGVDMI